MKPENIINKRSFIKYIKSIDNKNLYKYIKLIEFYEKNCIHDVYKISSYIFSKIHNKLNEINNIFNYFSKSFSENINKLNNYSIKQKSNNPKWLNSNIDDVTATQDEIAEMNELLKEYK